MTMFSWDIKHALNALDSTFDGYSVPIKKIVPAYDGIIFELEGNTTYKYFYMDGGIHKLEYWRDQFKNK